MQKFIRFIRRNIKVWLPYGFMVWWLKKRYCVEIDRPFLHYRGFAKILRRAVKWSLPFCVVMRVRKVKMQAVRILCKMNALKSRLRQRREHRRFASSLKHCEIVFDHNLGGGANEYRSRYVEERLANGIPCIVVHNNLWFYEPRDYTLQLYCGKQRKSIDLHFASWAECEQWLKGISCAWIVYNNLVYNPDIAQVLRFIASSRAKLLVLMHDFFPICPFYVMVDSNGTFCHGKGDCETCIKAHSDKRHLLNMDIHAGTWKAMWAPIFKRAEEIRIFSPFAEKLIGLFYPEAIPRIRCVPHSMAYFHCDPVALDKGSGLVIGVVGCIYNEAKGTKVVEALAQALKPKKLIVVGTYKGCECDNIVTTGRFKREEIPQLLKSYGINIVLFPSIWPETFSYTVSELIMMNLPVVAFDVGAQGEKIRGYARGAIVPEISAMSILTSAAQLYNKVYGTDKGETK